MKLRALYESRTRRLFKALNQSSYDEFLKHRIPGFMAEYDLAIIYAQPSLTGVDRVYLISAEVDLGGVLDLSSKVEDMSFDWESEFPELRSEVWKAYGSGHGGKEAIYYGKPLLDFKLEAVFDSDDEWRQAK